MEGGLIIGTMWPSKGEYVVSHAAVVVGGEDGLGQRGVLSEYTSVGQSVRGAAPHQQERHRRTLVRGACPSKRDQDLSGSTVSTVGAAPHQQEMQGPTLLGGALDATRFFHESDC